MSEDAEAIVTNPESMSRREREESIVRRLATCVAELDALGLLCEANHVALGRDLIEQRWKAASPTPLAEESDQPVPFRRR
ncbi:MAG: hypothetical protein JWN59_1614 [Sphingomonas bacterium]|jgi:hypothetical protein|nr:hypothetical protein [Sphingomonas bacterium]MDB5684128.1 hypothetical protein [Sphingomonas bacterium]